MTLSNGNKNNTKKEYVFTMWYTITDLHSNKY